MGMHTWYVQRSEVPTSEALVLEQFDSMAANGWQAVGYNLVVIDDKWQGTRDPSGVLQPDAAVFPHGMKWLAGVAHARGFKLGIYTEPTARTAAGRIGSEGHLAQDARTFADWGIDFIKFDTGLIPGDQLTWRPEHDTAEFGAALEAVNWKGHLHVGLGLSPFAPWVQRWAKSWRGSYGVPPYSSWAPGSGVDVAQATPLAAKTQILMNWDRMMQQAQYHSAGKFASFDSCPSWFAGSDPTGFRFCVTLFSMGGVDMFCHNFRAPGDWNYPLSKALLTGEYLRINQDPLCAPPIQVQTNNLSPIYGVRQGWEVWKRQLSPATGPWQAVLLLNRDETNAVKIPLSWPALGYNASTPLQFVNLETGSVEVVCEKEVTVPAFSTVMYKVAPAGSADPFASSFVCCQRLRSGQFSFTAASLPGTSLVLMAASSLLPNATWTAVATNTADAGGTAQIVDTSTDVQGRRFYRLQVCRPQ